jgi:FkbM family methyltransferase
MTKQYQNINEWETIPGDRALGIALAKADSINDQTPTVTDYQKNKLNTALGFVKNFTTAIDAGASYGIMSYNLNEQFSKIYAFEVDTSVRECLKKNVEKFQLDNVVVCECGLGDKEETVSLIYNKNTFCTHVNRMMPGTNICKTLDSFELTEVGFIKLDCEGYEPYILQGAEHTIKKYKPVILMENKNYSNRYYGEEGNLAVDLLLAWGYTMEVSWPKDCVMVHNPASDEKHR